MWRAPIRSPISPFAVHWPPGGTLPGPAILGCERARALGWVGLVEIGCQVGGAAEADQGRWRADDGRHHMRDREALVSGPAGVASPRPTMHDAHFSSRGPSASPMATKAKAVKGAAIHERARASIQRSSAGKVVGASVLIRGG